MLRGQLGSHLLFQLGREEEEEEGEVAVSLSLSTHHPSVSVAFDNIGLSLQCSRM